MNIKKAEIPGLHRIQKKQSEKVFQILLDAFQEYPKLLNAFPSKERRLKALEMTIRFYGSYDFHYGACYSLDESISEAILMVHSDQMKYSIPRDLISGCYNAEYCRIRQSLSKEERRRLSGLFNELDALEETISIPRPHIYVDFLGTLKAKQGQGRGRKLMNHVCSFADKIQLPVMLFTNTDYDVKFYESLGFTIIDSVSSREYGFNNTYMMYYPKCSSK